MTSDTKCENCIEYTETGECEQLRRMLPGRKHYRISNVEWCFYYKMKKLEA